MLSTVCSGEVTRNFLRYRECTLCRFYAPQNKLADVYFIRITIHILYYYIVAYL